LKYCFNASLLFLCLIIITFGAQANNDPVELTIGTTPSKSERITGDPDRPGWLVELFNAVEPLANVRFKYVFNDWDQVLRLVRTGRIEAAFNSSYKVARAVYGSYPMKDGKPDPSKATVEYEYSLYVRRDSNVKWDGSGFENLNGPVALEKGAAILPRLQQLGLETREITSYRSMLSLLAGGRIDAIAAIDVNVDVLQKQSPERFGGIVKVSPPLQTRTGYLMFSKIFCDRDRNICNAVWNAIRDVKMSESFRNIRAQYDGD
jgi:polar amino acid transport system substrate-binding protein